MIFRVSNDGLPSSQDVDTRWEAKERIEDQRPFGSTISPKEKYINKDKEC
jgi:hypothetical protein